MNKKIEFFEKISDDECFEMLARDGGIAFNSDAKTYEIRDEYDRYKLLAAVEKLVAVIEKGGKRPYRIFFKNGKWQYHINNKRLVALMGGLAAMWNEIQIEGRFYSPKIQITILAVQRMILLAWKSGDPFYPDVRWRRKDEHRLYRYVRVLLKSEKYKEQRKQVNKSVSRRFHDAVNYALAHLQKMSKMLVVSVDAHIRDEYKDTIDEKEIRRLRERLLDEIRKDERFDCVEGYITKAEEGIDRGPHLHLIFFINGQTNKNASYWATEIGELWKNQVTLERGYYHNCHQGNTKYAWRDVGMVRYNDRDSIMKLVKAISYLVKPDQYFFSRSQIKANMFTKGKWPKPRKDKRGRPRKDLGIDFSLSEEVMQFLMNRKVSK